MVTVQVTERSSELRSGTDIVVKGVMYERMPIRVIRLIKFGENLEDVLNEFVKPYFKPGDWVLLSSKIISVCQNRVRHISTVRVTWLARFIEKGVLKHKNMTGWSKPEKIQVAIDEVGVPRIMLSMLVGGIGKIFGMRGLFWRIAGHRVSEIDGFIPEDMYPYTEWAVLPPENPQSVCDRIEKELRMPIISADANYINVKMLGLSGGIDLDFKTMRLVLLDNPCGQGNKMTPFALVRRKNTV